MIWRILKSWFYRARAAITNTVNVSVLDGERDIWNRYARSVTADDGALLIVLPDGSTQEFALDECQQVLVTVG